MRTVAGLTGAEQTIIDEGGYIIAAILPEITVDVAGQYELEAELAEEAPAGAELVWFAFPRDAEPSEDDKIADFYDEAGADTTVVPESHKVIVEPWFNPGVTYAPVIAVKAPEATNAKGTLEGVEEGQTVTETALEEAAAAPATETSDAAPVVLEAPVAVEEEAAAE